MEASCRLWQVCAYCSLCDARILTKHPSNLGLTECVSPVTLTPATDIAPGSSGLLLPSVKARLIDAAGEDIDEHEIPGELYLKSPTRIPGYLGESEEDDAKFLVGGWLPTGDIGFFRQGIDGNEHLFLVDRVKDMIKVKVCFPRLETFTLAGVARLTNDSRVYKSALQLSKTFSACIPPSATQQSLVSKTTWRANVHWLS